MQEIIPYSASADSRPLPLIVAEKWHFKLAYVYENGVFYFAIVDWITRVLSTTSRNATQIWLDFRRSEDYGMMDSILQFSYTAKNGRDYKMDYTNDKGLYIITQGFRITKNRPLLREIQEYLAKAGAFVDFMRREPEKALESIASNPDKVLDTIIKMYQREGKSNEWILMRMNTKIQRAAFTSALKAAMLETAQTHYGLAL